VLVPFIVFFYAKIFKADYFYHLQDIHPEAANIVMPINRFVLSFLRYLDNLTMKNAKCLITISEDMQNFIYNRSGSETPIALLDNPAIDLGLTNTVNRDRDFIFIGNLGRLQRIPLLITSIKRYLEKNGSSNFTFVGGGVYSSQIQDLAQKFDAVEYLGKVSAQEAAEITSIHRWAILSINDEVTPLAFPSKSSSYVFSGCKILALCGNDTSVARWTVKHNLGLVALPNENSLVSCFFRLETEKWTKPNVSSELRKRLDINFFVNRLIQFCELKNV
jgi:glycosyltransferase involved in cell wall biosynthesis